MNGGPSRLQVVTGVLVFAAVALVVVASVGGIRSMQESGTAPDVGGTLRLKDPGGGDEPAVRHPADGSVIRVAKRAVPRAHARRAKPAVAAATAARTAVAAARRVTRATPVVLPVQPAPTAQKPTASPPAKTSPPSPPKPPPSTQTPRRTPTTDDEAPAPKSESPESEGPKSKPVKSKPHGAPPVTFDDKGTTPGSDHQGDEGTRPHSDHHGGGEGEVEFDDSGSSP